MSISIFFSYSHKDEALRDKVAEHLSALKRSNVIQEWHDLLIPAGSEWKAEIDRNLRTADIILLLVSASFINSEYCWSEELEIAMTRHEAKEACVIPIILRPCDWQETPFAKLQVLPKDAKAVTLWSNEDEALTNVAQGIRDTIRQITKHKKQPKVRAGIHKADSKLELSQISSYSSIKCQSRDEIQSDKSTSYALLREMLKAGQWQLADQETRRVMCVVMQRQRQGWLRKKDIQEFPCADLNVIDHLWTKYSSGKFGFSTQRKIYAEVEKLLNGEYSRGTLERFLTCVGWRIAAFEQSPYPNVIYDSCAPTGHLPTVGLWLNNAGWVYWGRAIVGVRRGGTVGLWDLFYRLEACEVKNH